MQWLLARHFAQSDIAEAGNWTSLLDLGRNAITKKKLFQGHFFGPLEQLVGKRLFTFTLLRDPVERALSHYGHVMRDTTHYLHQQAVALGSFDAYIENPETRMTVSNFQARMLALEFDVESLYRGLSPMERASWYVERHIETTDFGLGGDALLSAAQSVLDRFEMVGITERFRHSLALLCYKRSWSYPEEMVDRNVNLGRIRCTDLAPSTLQRLEQLNDVDVPLYEHARTNFEAEFDRMVISSVNEHQKSLGLGRFIGLHHG